MVLVELIVVVLILVLMDKSKTVKINKKVSEMTARGEFLPTNYNRFNMLWQDAAYDWDHERKMFPKEYWAYLERNEEARNAYIKGLVAQQEMKEGLKPVLCSPYYNKDTFNPFGSFEPYKEKIKTFNETGRYYF